MAEKGCSFRATMAVVEAAYALANAISLSQHYHGKNRLPALLKGILPDVLEYSSRETFNTPEMYELSQMYFDLAGFSAMASAASRQKSRLLAEMRSDKDMAALVDIERLARKLAEQRYDGCGYPGEAVTITHILEQLQALSPMNRKGYSGFLNPILAGIQGHYAGTTVAAHIEAALESFEKKA